MNNKLKDLIERKDREFRKEFEICRDEPHECSCVLTSQQGHEILSFLHQAMQEAYEQGQRDNSRPMCKSCGGKLSDSRAFCDECGADQDFIN